MGVTVDGVTVVGGAEYDCIVVEGTVGFMVGEFEEIGVGETVLGVTVWGVTDWGRIV